MAAADVTDGVWDHVLLGAPAPAECALPAGLLARMRREFRFWYPFDLRVRRQGLSEKGFAAARKRMRSPTLMYLVSGMAVPYPCSVGVVLIVCSCVQVSSVGHLAHAQC